MGATVEIDFAMPELARAVERVPMDEVDRLPFGAIRIDQDGVVVAYSKAERGLSGSGDLERLGRSFFAEIAPCMNNGDYRGRIEAAMARGTLDLEFTHIGDFADREREITVRVQSASAGGYWIFMRRED